MLYIKLRLIYITKGQDPMSTCLHLPTPPPTPNDYPSIHCLCEFSVSSFRIALRLCGICLFVQFHLV